MHRPQQSSAQDPAPLTEVCFDAAVLEVLDREAARSGVTVAEYVHDAALARAAVALRALGEDSSDLSAGRARTLFDEEPGDGERRADQQRLIDAPAQRQRREIRDEAAAVRAESRQARHRAAEVRGETNAILDTVVLLVTEVLRGQGFALLEPVVARFRTADSGNTGVDVAVHLEDPSQARAAKAAIVERFPDRLSQVTVA